MNLRKVFELKGKISEPVRKFETYINFKNIRKLEVFCCVDKYLSSKVKKKKVDKIYPLKLFISWGKF
jgi:hypothetical protein